MDNSAARFEEVSKNRWQGYVRQKFVEEIDLGSYTPYVREVVYDPGPSFLPRALMETIPHPLALLGITGLPSKIKVYPLAFEGTHPFIDDFVNTLRYHEGLHARNNYLKGHPMSMTLGKKGERWYWENDLAAHINQLRNMKGVRHSARFLIRVTSNVRKIQRMLNEMSNRPT